MTTPFYVSPEQWYQDKAEYARKGIARGRPIVAIEYDQGITIMAENPSASLRKISEIYDRMAFAGVGKFDEYENLRKSGVRYADMRGYSYSREDVAGKNLANEYSNVLGTIFTREMKSFEVDILVIEVGLEPGDSSMYRILFDGSIADHKRFAAIGVDADQLLDFLKDGWKEGLALNEAVRLGRETLGRVSDGAAKLDASNLEIAVLDRKRAGRKFRRLPREEVEGLLTG
jgi:proteasome alpha subunit